MFSGVALRYVSDDNGQGGGCCRLPMEGYASQTEERESCIDGRTIRGYEITRLTKEEMGQLEKAGGEGWTGELYRSSQLCFLLDQLLTKSSLLCATTIKSSLH
jgi:hypothetical protein